MKKISLKFLWLHLWILYILVFAGCLASRKLSTAYTGTWEYIAYDTPEGDIKDTFIIELRNGQYSGRIRAMDNDLALEELEIINNKLTAFANFQGYRAMLTGEFSGNLFAGKGKVENNEFRITAVRKE